jgi:hypothetical protein
MSKAIEKTFNDGSRAGQERGISRPNGAVAYYLGRPARLWITALSARRKRTAFKSGRGGSPTAPGPLAPASGSAVSRPPPTRTT